MKRFCTLLLVINLIAWGLGTSALALESSGSISVTATAATTAIGGRVFCLVNTGTNEFYFRISTDSAVTAATTSSGQVRAQDIGMCLDAPDNKKFSQISTIASSGETTTVSYWWFD